MGFLPKKDKVKYLDAWTSRGDVKLTYRDKKGKKHTKTIENYGTNDWYFYISKDGYDSLDPDDVQSIENGELSILKESAKFEVESDNWVRVYVRNENINERYTTRSDDRIRLKSLLESDGVKVFEADLKPHKRYCLDNNIQVADNYKVLYYDIEIDDRNPGLVIGRDQILTIACVNQEGKTYFFHSEDERELLTNFYDFLRWDYDILVGYNSDNFDLPYILKRMEKHFLDDEVAHLKYRAIHIDLMQVFIKKFAGDSEITQWSLNFIANHFLGHGKIDVQMGGGKGYALYKSDFEAYKEYNIMDAQLLYDLNHQLSIVDQIILECQITGAFPSNFSISQMLDNFILKYATPRDIHFPSIEYRENQVKCPKCNHSYQSPVPIEEIVGNVICSGCGNSFTPNTDDDEIKGAFVFDPVVGLHENIYVFDYKSLYPSIIRTWNIGPDTFIEPSGHEEIDVADVADHFYKSANGQFFIRQDGTIKNCIQRLLDLRKTYKNRMNDFKEGTEDYKSFKAKQNAVKMLANSMYGLMGYQYGRFYRKEVAEAITLGGQWLNKKTKKWFEEKGFDVIYGDTDSVFVKSNRDLELEIDGLLKELHEFYDDILLKTFNVDRHFIELEFEKKYKRLLLIKKKNYVGHIIKLEGKDVDKVSIKGLECIKRDTIPLGKVWQRELIDMIMLEDHDLDFYIEWVKTKMDLFFSGDYELDDIIIKKKLTKNPAKYKTATAHATIATEMMKRQMECYVGMQIPFIVISERPIVAVHPDWYENNASIAYYWDQQIYGILKRVLEVAFKEYDWDQYSTKIRKRREKKIDQFLKWFKDPKKKKPNLLEKLRTDPVLSQKDKSHIKIKAGIRTFKRKILEDESATV